MKAALLVAAGLSGLCAGSFCATYAIRFDRGEQAITGRSRCDHCDRSLSPIESLPLLGYAFARGRCRTCKAPIHPDHLVGELLGGSLAVMIVALVPFPKSVLIGVIGFALLISALIDRRTQRLPDLSTALIACAGAGLASLGGLETFVLHLAVAMVAFGVLLSVRALSGLRGKGPGLGLGDVKLVSALALWLGPLTPWMVALASALGLIAVIALNAWRSRLAFGPMLALSAMMVGIAQEAWFDRQGGLFDVR